MDKMFFSIEQARKYKGLTQSEMAEKLGISRSTYIAYEQHKTPMRIDTAYKFADIVGIPLDNIYFFDHKLHFKCS